MPFCDSETGDYNHLPVEGAIMDQPYITMRILDLIKLNFKNHIAETREKKMAEMKQKANRKGRR